MKHIHLPLCFKWAVENKWLSFALLTLQENVLNTSSITASKACRQHVSLFHSFPHGSAPPYRGPLAGKSRNKAKQISTFIPNLAREYT